MPEHGVYVYREQLLRKGGLTPEYINKPIPTEPIRLRFGPRRGTASRRVGSAFVLGTFRFVGSPREFTYQVTKLRLSVSTPNFWFAITHSRQTGGTIDTPYMAARGDALTVTNPQEPILSFPPGTVRWYALGAGTRGIVGTLFEGFGSVNPGHAALSTEIYPV